MEPSSNSVAIAIEPSNEPSSVAKEPNSSSAMESSSVTKEPNSFAAMESSSVAMEPNSFATIAIERSSTRTEATESAAAAAATTGHPNATKRTMPLIEVELKKIKDTTDKYKEYRPLHQAIMGGDYWYVKDLCEDYGKKKLTLQCAITKSLDTPLMVAVMTGRRLNIIKLLLDVPGDKCELGFQNKLGNNVLHEAAIVGHVQAAKLLLEIDRSLILYRNDQGYLPLHSAAFCGQSLILSFFLQQPQVMETLTRDDSTLLLHLAINARLFGVALYLLWNTSYELALESRDNPLVAIAEGPSAFPSGTRLNIWRRFLYHWFPMSNNMLLDDVENATESSQAQVLSKDYFFSVGRKLRALGTWGVLEIIVPHLKHVREIKLMHACLQVIVFELCYALSDSPDDNSEIIKRSFLLGVKNGIEDIVDAILFHFPNTIDLVYEEKKCSAVHDAVKYRHEKVFDIIMQQNGAHKQLLSEVDEKGNNILHLVGQMPYQPQLKHVSGAVLQIQHELLWYKEVEKRLPPHARTKMNDEMKTPSMVFEEEHRKLFESEKQWMMSMANACTVATTIIGTIAFSAAIQVPGATDNEGHPNLYTETVFKIFAASNAIALYSAISTFLIFLSIFTARYAIIDFLFSLPNRLIIGMLALFLSVISTITSFSSALFLMSSSRKVYHVIFAPVAILSIIPVILFAFFQFPPLRNMMKSTYGRGMLSALERKRRREEGRRS